MKKLFNFIATKDKLLAEVGVDSHQDLIEMFELREMINFELQFVRCRLSPLEDLDIKNWRFKVDQDIRPDWFLEDEWRDRAIEYLEENPLVVEKILNGEKI